MPEGLQAGHLTVPVVADLSGFTRALRTKVESAAKSLAVKVKVKVDADNLQRKLEDAVEASSRGLLAKVKIKVDDRSLRTELDNVVRQISDVRIAVDDQRLRTGIDNVVRQVSGVRIPVRPDGESGGRGRRGGFLAGLRSLISGAQVEAERTPVSVPVQMRLPRGRGSLRMLGLASLLSLVQPAVAALAQYGAGLTALASAAAPAVGVLAALPGGIVAAGAAAVATKVAFSGFGEALKQTLKAQEQAASGVKRTKAQQQALAQSLDGISASAKKSVTTLASLTGAWHRVRTSVQERFFGEISDEIKPLARSVLPLLGSALGNSAGQMGSLAARGAEFMQSGPFRADFKKVAASNTAVVGHMTDGLANLGRAGLDFLVTARPFTEWVGSGIESLTAHARASVQAGRETGSLARFLDNAREKSTQLGRSTWNLVKGLGGVGRAGQETGNALLDGFEGTTSRFKRWATSAKGQISMKAFFSDAAPTFHELNRLVADFFRGLGRASKDTSVADLIRQVRVELMPAVGSFFNAVGQSIGPALISLVSNLATAFGGLAEAGTGLGVLLVAFNGVLHAINSLTSAVPGLNTALAVLLGTVLVLKVLSGVTGMLRGFGSSIASAAQSATSLGTAMRGSVGPGAVGPTVGVWQQMGGAYRTASADGNRLTGTLRGIGAANRAASTAAGGMTAALGGPLGIAITLVTIGLGLLASRQEAAARAAAAHQERINSLAQSLADSGGAIDANVRAQAAQYLQDIKLADGKGKLVDALRTADVTLKQVTDAYLDQGGSIEGLEKKLRGLAKETQHYVAVGPKSEVIKMTPEGERYQAAADALKGMSGELDKSKAKAKELNEAVNGTAGTGSSAYDRLQAAVQGYSDKTQSADERTTSLRRALDALNGNAQSFHDASSQLNAVMLRIDDTMKNTIERTDGWGAALVGTDSLVNTSSRNGQTLNTQLTELRDSMLAVTMRAQEAAEQALMPMSEAMDKSQAAMERARAKAIQLATGMGVPEVQAKALADQMGLVPETITTLMVTKGIPESTAQILGLRSKLESLGAGKSITVKAPTGDARAQLELLGFKVQSLPGGKSVRVTAPTKGARADIGALAADIANAPNSKNVTVRTIIAKATGDLTAIRNKVAELPPGKKLVMEAPTATAQRMVKELGFKVKELKGRKVEITAPTSSAVASVQAIQRKINSLSGRTVTVTVKYSAVGKPYVSEQADGGIVQYAEGGIRAASSRVRAFASGAERHIAQIARPGEWRLWAEPETGGEAYIPLAASKRRRSAQILDSVARRFGGMVVYPDRDVQQLANGAVRLHQQGGAARAPAPRPARPQRNAPASLVGGDLNLHMTSEPMAPGEALNEAMFELRRIRLGGTYVSG
ncbi:hypothetical protein ACIQCR_17145 [Streptomyces sp. NPDC093249]|uniref:hypothetical protein n=1 Tax=unclassified Streptomyces TaxID=2593676 RepID=UPI00344FA55D